MTQSMVWGYLVSTVIRLSLGKLLVNLLQVVKRTKTYYYGEYFHRLFLSLTGISDAEKKNIHNEWDQKSSLFLGSEIIEARNQRIW